MVTWASLYPNRCPLVDAIAQENPSVYPWAARRRLRSCTEIHAVEQCIEKAFVELDVSRVWCARLGKAKNSAV